MHSGQVQTPLRRLLTGLMLGECLMLVALMTPAVLLLSFKMIEIDPHGYTSSYGLVSGIGALFALIGNPLGGAISDRTNISFGRRRTWIVIGTLIGSASLFWVGSSTEIWQVVVGWSIAQLFFNFSIAAYSALIPDQVDVSKQGTASGIVGMLLPISMAVGMILMMVLTSVPTIEKWALLSILGIVGPIISVFFIQDGKIELQQKPKLNLGLGERLSKVFPNPRNHPAFIWAMASKFLLMMGYCSTLYLTIMLVNRMGFSEAQATQSVGVINLLSMVAMALTSIFGGVLSDRFGKQKPFLYWSAIIMALGVLTYAFIPQYMSYVIASVIIGFGYGCFSAVDMALVARILPNKEDSAKDFGLMNTANALPQSIVPAIAPVLLGIGGWSFFYITLTICVVLGAIAVRPLPERSRESSEDLSAASYS
jgi:MFS family permease